MLSNSLYPHRGCFVVLVRAKTTNCLLVSKRRSSRFCIKLFRPALPCVFQPLYSLPQIFFFVHDCFRGPHFSVAKAAQIFPSAFFSAFAGNLQWPEG